MENDDQFEPHDLDDVVNELEPIALQQLNHLMDTLERVDKLAGSAHLVNQPSV